MLLLGNATFGSSSAWAQLPPLASRLSITTGLYLVGLSPTLSPLGERAKVMGESEKTFGDEY
jgi:hypothetical protein